jgi:hypothetical protein
MPFLWPFLASLRWFLENVWLISIDALFFNVVGRVFLDFFYWYISLIVGFLKILLLAKYTLLLYFFLVET